jgi:hypothetical protein
MEYTKTKDILHVMKGLVYKHPEHLNLYTAHENRKMRGFIFKVAKKSEK